MAILCQVAPAGMPVKIKFCIIIHPRKHDVKKINYKITLVLSSY